MTAPLIHQLFEERAARTPAAVALVSNSQEVTAAELNLQANRIAHRILRLSGGREAFVGVDLERSVEAVAALLGILKAGAAFVYLVGKEHAGGLFTKAILERLLSNVIYIGKISYQDALYAGEQKPVIKEELWKQVSEKLVQERNHDAAARKTSGTAPRHSSAIAERRESIPRITRLLALALKFEELIRSGSVSNYAALAQVAQVSRSRVTQMTSLLNLAPDIQEEILFLTAAEARERGISEPSLRKLTATLLWTQQREQWKSLRRFSRNVQR